MGMNDFAPYLKINGCFIVQNVSPQVKTIKIFQYPINYGCTRDLLDIPGVAESDIRSSLLKGELQHKILAQDIRVICSDVDLLQFNGAQKAFLQGAGIVNGLDIGTGSDDWLLDNDPVEPSNIYMPTYTGPQLSAEAWLRDDFTLIKKINYSFTGPFLTQEVRQVFDSQGIDVTAQLTIDYTYTGPTLTSYTATRDI